MLKRTVKYGQIFIAGFIASLALPVISSGENRGQDWYCSEPEVHAQYQKHLKAHLENQTEIITAKLEKIFNDSSLTIEQKRAKTAYVLDKYLSRIKAGIGD